jgi:hypothetical protein
MTDTSSSIFAFTADKISADKLVALSTENARLRLLDDLSQVSSFSISAFPLCTLAFRKPLKSFMLFIRK